jgi:hypothetical protein
VKAIASAPVPVIETIRPCNCMNLWSQAAVSSVRHKNTCPVKQEAIARLHLSPENPFVISGC